MVMIRLAVISPLGPRHRSRDALLVAILQVKPALESSVSRGMKAEFGSARHAELEEVGQYERAGRLCYVDLGAERSWCFPGRSCRRSARIDVDDDVAPDLDVLCAEDRCAAVRSASQSLVSANSIFSEGTPSGPDCLDDAVALVDEVGAGDAGLHVERQDCRGSDAFETGRRPFCSGYRVILLTEHPGGIAGVNLRFCTVFIPCIWNLTASYTLCTYIGVAVTSSRFPLKLQRSLALQQESP